MNCVLALALAAPFARAMDMGGSLGQYPMAREASGTAWQPDSSPEEGLHVMRGDWSFMAHGFAQLAYDHQGGPRGASKPFAASMLMGMARRELPVGTLGLRAMLSLDPATIGKDGYPLLAQSGETTDGVTPLVDRQHPHDFFDELGATYSAPIGGAGSAFVYAALPGEPALGPATFTHRASGQEIPEAPITHHWLDSTHVAMGVATVGGTWGPVKLDASRFTGREPDQNRWDIDRPLFDSNSIRATYNPSQEWSMQASYGHLRSPEQLEPGVDVDRVTASATWNRAWDDGNWQTTFAWGRNNHIPGPGLDAFLLESTARRGAHTGFARAERATKDDLLPSAGPEPASKVTAGYLYDFAEWKGSRWGAGASGSLLFLPRALRPSYGPLPGAFMLFLRVKLV